MSNLPFTFLKPAKRREERNNRNGRSKRSRSENGKTLIYSFK